MFTNTLDAIKGWFHEAALDHSAASAGGQTGTADSAGTAIEYKQGMVASLNASDQLVLGCGGDSVGIFLLNSEDDPDVANASFAGSGEWVAIGPSGTLSGLVATGGYELESTEYDDDAYAPGQALFSVLTGNVKCGILDKGTTYLDNIVGIVSKAQVAEASSGHVKNSHGQSVLRFWSVWLPAAPLNTTGQGNWQNPAP
jgi:hypothetical protein